MPLGSPNVPLLIQCRNLSEIGQVDQHLEQLGAVTADMIQSGIDLGENLPHLTVQVRRQLIGNFDEVGHTAMNDGIGPATSDAMTLDG